MRYAFILRRGARRNRKRDSSCSAGSRSSKRSISCNRTYWSTGQPTNRGRWSQRSTTTSQNAILQQGEKWSFHLFCWLHDSHYDRPEMSKSIYIGLSTLGIPSRLAFSMYRPNWHGLHHIGNCQQCRPYASYKSCYYSQCMRILCLFLPMRNSHHSHLAMWHQHCISPISLTIPNQPILAYCVPSLNL